MPCYGRTLTDTPETEKLWFQAEAYHFRCPEKHFSASETGDFGYSCRAFTFDRRGCWLLIIDTALGPRLLIGCCVSSKNCRGCSPRSLHFNGSRLWLRTRLEGLQTTRQIKPDVYSADGRQK